METRESIFLVLFVFLLGVGTGVVIKTVEVSKDTSETKGYLFKLPKTDEEAKAQYLKVIAQKGMLEEYFKMSKKDEKKS